MDDYCTLFPDGWWSECCKAHDYAYANGADKALSDIDLFKCVAESNMDFLSIAIASLMFVGVSVFGWFFYKRK